MSDHITRSVTITTVIDQVLADLAAEEGTTRAALIREGITRALQARQIFIDAQQGIDTSRVRVTHTVDRRASLAEVVRLEFLDWWADHRDELLAATPRPDLLDQVVDLVASNVRRDGRVSLDIVAEMVPGTWQADYRTSAAVERTLLFLAQCGAIRRLNTRGRRTIQPAPWVTPDRDR